MIAFTSISQLVIGPSVKLFPPGKEKSVVVEAIKKRRIPVVDSAIVIQILTALYFAHSRWDMIAGSPLMAIKAMTGTFALTFAAALHFYFRFLKNKAQRAGDQDRLTRLNSKTAWMEKAVLVTGAFTYISGVLFNHL